MNRRLATATLAAAVGLVLAGATANAQMDPKKMTMEKMEKSKMEKCYGISAKGKNDCAEGAHSCAGQSTLDRDKASFMLVPAGDCGKIAGGSLKGA